MKNFDTIPEYDGPPEFFETEASPHLSFDPKSDSRVLIYSWNESEDELIQGQEKPMGQVIGRGCIRKIPVGHS
jgi:hypothetical protein